jgi:hypothetical protein
MSPDPGARAESLWPTLLSGRCPSKEVREPDALQAFGLGAAAAGLSYPADRGPHRRTVPRQLGATDVHLGRQHLDCLDAISRPTLGFQADVMREASVIGRVYGTQLPDIAEPRSEAVRYLPKLNEAD